MKLTKNFSKWEFESKDGAEMPFHVLEHVKKLAEYLQIIRDHINAKISINSGYRSPEHNEAVGGEDESKHMEGIAADMVPYGITPKELYAIIEELTECGKLPEGGMKAYLTFVHWDYRGKRVRW